ncbi:MAG TPA: T9SS type A sorting domain-containing protein, partial [Sunxiuqinia sp.]|nr:T9SS type A sorting domain-containing protein [Sunxiuqinia sp.]
HDNATNIAILKNLYISNRQRNPLFKGGACGVVVNNYIYNPGNMAIRYALVPSEWEGYTWQTGRMSIVGNVLQYGPNTSNIPLMRATGGACEIYFDDNIAKNRSGENVQIYSGDGTNIVGQPPIWNENIQSMNATEVKNYVVGHAGARPWDRDEVDQRLINELLTGTGQVIDYETEVGGYPTTTPMNAPFQAENWNMELMIQKHAGLILTTPVVGDTISQNTTFIVQVDTGSFSKEIEFLELLVNGESAGKRMAIPYQWTVNTDVVGSDELVVVAGVKNGRLWVSSTLNKEVVAGSGTGFLDNNSSDHFKLYNFPNPFSTQTTIHYQMAHSGHVQLRLFNDSGKMIADHALGNQLAGIHRWNWDAGNLPPGTYLLLLKVGEQLFQHKLSLCK